MSDLGFDLTKVLTYGDHSLKDYDILDVNVMPENIDDLKTGSKASVGFFKKFIIVPSKDLPTIYVKSGGTTGDYYSILHPIQEYICSCIGRLLGFDIVNTLLWSINTDIFSIIDKPRNIQQEGTCPDCESEIQYCQCNFIFAKSIPSPAKTFSSILGTNGRTLVSLTLTFIKKGYEFTSASSEFGEVRSSELYDKIAAKYGSNYDVMSRIHQMMVFDYLVGNTDRHTSNFGFLTNVQTGKVTLAPLYDHGLSFGLQIGDDFGLVEDGPSALKRGGGKPFGSLELGFMKADHKDLLGLNLDRGLEDLLSIVEKFKPVLPPLRYQVIENILTERWSHVQRVYSQAKG